MSVVAADPLQAIAQLLLGSAVAPLVSGRIRPLTAATTDHLPLLTYQEASGETFDTFQGSATWEKITVQLDAFAGDYATAKSILAAIKGTSANPGVLHNFSGVVGNVTIGIARWKDDFDASESPDIGQEMPIVRLQSNYAIIFHV
jgi:hypothetical protein